MSADAERMITFQQLPDFKAAMAHKSLSPKHLPSADIISGWPRFTPDRPLRILVSGCLAGMAVGADGSTYGAHPHIAELMRLPNVKATPFCPENFSFGTPRATCDIHGGDGHEVLAHRARVLTPQGEDWTDGMIAAAHEMLRMARQHLADLAVLMDMSAACGSQVIYSGARRNAPYQAAHGVCAALLVQEGIPVVSQRDFKTLDQIRCKLDPERKPTPALHDHHQTEWYRGYFRASGA
jgi:uncharacterized protein YbbK (DUF523 family)